MSHTLRRQLTSVLKVLWYWILLMDFTPSHCGWGNPETAPGGTQRGWPFLWVLKSGSCLSLCPCTHLDLQKWAYGGLVAPIVGLGIDCHSIIWVSVLLCEQVSFYHTAQHKQCTMQGCKEKDLKGKNLEIIHLLSSVITIDPSPFVIQ